VTPSADGSHSSWSPLLRSKPLPYINDCASLVRRAIWQAVTEHDSVWSESADLPLFPAIPSVKQFAWPRTPLGPKLFQTGDSQYGEFADVTTLRRYNSHFISRETANARPGDSLFYRQSDRQMPSHVMIYVGSSQLAP